MGRPQSEYPSLSNLSLGCVVVSDAVVASHERASDRDHTRYDWQH